ncbi:MAG: phytase, partial [Pseudomonadota bacterium]|nr:phytase [Pseudomonadota bacterium]
MRAKHAVFGVAIAGLLVSGCVPLRGPTESGAQGQATVVAEASGDRQLGATAVLIDAGDGRRNRIIVADDDAGLAFYDATGRRTASHAIGAVEGLDLRDGFAIGGRSVQLLAVADEKGRRLAFYGVDGDKLAALGSLKLDAEPSVVCLQRATGDAWFAFAVDGDGGVSQWQLYAKGQQVSARPVRSFSVGAEVEACAADDRAGALYLIESDTAVWRYRSDPEAEIARVPIAVRGPVGPLESPQALALAGEATLLVDRDAGVLRVLDREAPYTQRAVLSLDRLGIGEAGSLATSTQAFATSFPAGVLAWIDERATEGGARLKLFDLRSLLADARVPTAAAAPVPMLASVTPSAET